ncbi:MAG: hypothetical protein E7290_06795 [Lachnospiraceae bacterium]|nr:hypothetical protein [Lachnospiraceae bacterium]
MNKRMDKMRKDVENRLKRTKGIGACLLAFSLTMMSGVFPVDLGDTRANDFVTGFQAGILILLLLVYLAKLVKYQKALKDEKLLKQLYHQENDERMVYVNQQVGKSSMSVNTVVLLLLAILAGYYNIVVFGTILVTIFVQCAIQIVMKWYYMNCVSVSDTEEE